MHDAGQEHHLVAARTLLEVFLRAEGGSSVPHGGLDSGADVVALVHAASGFDALADAVLDGHTAPVVEHTRARRDVRGQSLPLRAKRRSHATHVLGARGVQVVVHKGFSLFACVAD